MAYGQDPGPGDGWPVSPALPRVGCGGPMPVRIAYEPIGAAESRSFWEFRMLRLCGRLSGGEDLAGDLEKERAMPRRRLFVLRIVRDEAAQLSLFQSSSFRQDVLAALDPEVAATRYGRTWRLSQPRIENHEGWLWAKLGFERRAPSERTFYDIATHDFVSVPGDAEQGTFSHFVLDLETQYLCFEERPPEIRLGSFKGALDALLSQRHREYRLTAEVVPDVEHFEQWLGQVDSVLKFRVDLRRPNPNFAQRPESIRRLLETTNAAKVSLEAIAGEGESLDVVNSDLKSYTDYTSEGYGEVRATGEAAGRRRYFQSGRHMKSGDIRIEKEDSASIARRIFDALRDLAP